MGIIEGFWLQISPYFNLLQERGNYAVSIRNHKALVEALRRRDSEAAAEALHQDITDAAHILQSSTLQNARSPMARARPQWPVTCLKKRRRRNGS